MAIKINTGILKKFLKSESTGGILLLCCVAISLLLANSPWSRNFETLLSTEIGPDSSQVHLAYPIITWINDGLMAIFFLFVGLEIKRELIEGELSSPKRAILPVLAAIGGAIIPATIYLAFNKNGQQANGWGIPMATDIAFAIGVLSLLGKKVPPSLKIFLAALAIVDDLIAILVIAVFYSTEVHWNFLLYAAITFAGMLIMNRLKLRALWLYIVPGIFLWYFIHHSGIHATVAGVLTALAIPAHRTASGSPLEKLEHFLANPVNFIIMPIFALANTNIRFEAGMIEGLYSNLGLGIMLGLLVGKPIGITLMSWIVVKLGWGQLPREANWIHLSGIGLLGGIGFTMSIFIALLSFAAPALQTQSKFAILTASVMAGIAGFALLYAAAASGSSPRTKLPK